MKQNKKWHYKFDEAASNIMNLLKESLLETQ